MSIASMMAQNLRREKARLKGEALSYARRILPAAEVKGVLEDGPVRASGVTVRMFDGKPMVFHTDGSLRHALGRKVTKAARKQLKQARRAKKS